ncbi:hypothetical protein C2845_PM01G20470 [Panicum miliaceum]|uniref:Uncharacterized protein n=1 Tax=Panicum miliaceum TaxID=4540 RepID=A0A3L6THG9_PANMI|nr:hypothetical protein C2845_PM01G20470 [Panicum miliaceum]
MCRARSVSRRASSSLPRTATYVVPHYRLPRVLGQPLLLDGLILDDDSLSAPPWEFLERNGRREDAFFFALHQPAAGMQASS